MKTSLALVGFVALAFSFQAKASDCQNEYPFKSPTGRQLIRCEETGAVAREDYLALQAVEERALDEDGLPRAGFKKVTAYQYCFTSERRLAYLCSVVLDAKTREVLPLAAAIGKAL